MKSHVMTFSKGSMEGFRDIDAKVNEFLAGKDVVNVTCSITPLVVATSHEAEAWLAVCFIILYNE